MENKKFNFKKRQELCFNSMSNSSMLVIVSNPTFIRTNDTPFPYRPNSNMLWLVGYEEEESILVLHKNEEGKTKSVLFVLPREYDIVWSGEKIGPERAKREYHVDEAYENNTFKEWLTKTVISRPPKPITFYYQLGSPNKTIEDAIINCCQNPLATVYHPLKLISGLRAIKDDNEIEYIKKACEITAKAHIEAMKFANPGIKEKDIENVLGGYFKSNGASGLAYNHIVASGNNANVLHYNKNNDLCKDGDLVLIDAACEYRYYASDITRTFPINGKFTEPQKKIYQVVLEAQKKLISLCRTDKTWTEINDAAIKSLTEGLVSLGVLEGDVDKLIEEKKYRPFYMHGVGHPMGLDTHDPAYIRDKEGNRSKLVPGEIYTVEPGLYFSSSLEDIPKEYKGIGVRIEDDILITENNPVILTSLVPKEINEIETLMKSN